MTTMKTMAALLLLVGPAQAGHAKHEWQTTVEATSTKCEDKDGDTCRRWCKRGSKEQTCKVGGETRKVSVDECWAGSVEDAQRRSQEAPK